MMSDTDKIKSLKNFSVLIKRLGQIATESQQLRTRLERIEHDLELKTVSSSEKKSDKDLEIINATLDAILAIEREISELERRLAMLKSTK